ncbi:MAG: nucleotidyltransferase domain-containing protein [Candidatus Kapaibacteriota bacterium]
MNDINTRLHQVPKEKQELLEAILSDLAAMSNVQAVVLGGSYSTGMATDASDLDIGIYYFESEPFDISAIQDVAGKYAHDSSPTVTGFYEWGPWVNGGAWIHTQHGKVDFIYKNINQIQTTIDNAKKGVWENHYEQQPPFGFSSIIFLAETAWCIPLHDPKGIIAALKSQVAEYPPTLKQSVIQQSLWAAEFTIWYAESIAAKNAMDLYNIVGCLTRAVKSIMEALFAMNEIYPIGDKRAIETLEKAHIKPANLKQKIEAILSVDIDKSNTNISLIKSLWAETVGLTNGSYRSFYKL